MIRVSSDHVQERAFYDSHRNAPLAATDDDLYDHVRSGDAAGDKSKLSKRKPGDPGVTQQQLMRFFDPKFAKKHDDSTEVGQEFTNCNC